MLWFHKRWRSFRHLFDVYHGHDNAMVSQTVSFFQASTWRVSWAWQCYGFTNVVVLSGIYLTCSMGMTMLWFHKRCRSFRHLLDVCHGHDNAMVSQTLTFFQASTWRVSWAWQCYGFTNVDVLSGIYLTCIMGMTMLWFHKRCRSFRHLLDVYRGHDNVMVTQTVSYFQAYIWRVSWILQCYGFTNVVVLSGIYLTCIMGMTALSILFCVIVLNLHHEEKNTPVPRWLRYIYNAIAFVLCFRHYGTNSASPCSRLPRWSTRYHVRSRSRLRLRSEACSSRSCTRARGSLAIRRTRSWRRSCTICARSRAGWRIRRNRTPLGYSGRCLLRCSIDSSSFSSCYLSSCRQSVCSSSTRYLAGKTSISNQCNRWT